MALRFDSDVKFVKGVGPKLGELFAKRGVHTVLDLIELYPRTYEDRRAVRHIQSLVADQLVSIKARVIRVGSIAMGKSHRKLYDVTVGDATGRISCKYFRVPYRGYFERFAKDTEVRVVGKVILYRGKLEFHHPDIHPLGEEDDTRDELIPIYTEIEGLSSAKLGRMIQAALAQVEVPETLPAAVVSKNGLLSRRDALAQVHRPPVDQGDQFLNIRAPAQRRLIFDELFVIELHLALKRAGVERERAVPVQAAGDWPARLRAGLEFELTGAQVRAYDEIVTDLRRPHPMHRLVQGDVGSGKTLVALMAATFAAEGGVQTALMAPTEILAEQHAENAHRRLTPLGMRVALLTGGAKSRERRLVLDALRAGEIHLLIGTHALIEDDVEFAKLGLVVIDEQHRFGVSQRNRLKSKGLSPHFLVMTATPIPRTLAMTVYGDLDVSVIDELPKGRQPIVTRKTYQSKRPLVMGFMKEQLAKGRQAYVVYPLVEESETLELRNAMAEFENVRAEFTGHEVGLLHGRMKSAEKDAVMTRFRRNEIQVLVATTVIEVGVDVPNANIMVIEHAERFGLSQLHQLRGRVGRGEYKSYCVLVLGHALSEEATKRAEIMESTNDGFKIAEADLEMRGPGEFLGTRQSGLPGFKVANLVRDVEILKLARTAAFGTIAGDPALAREEHAPLKAALDALHQHWIG